MAREAQQHPTAQTAPRIPIQRLQALQVKVVAFLVILAYDLLQAVDYQITAKHRANLFLRPSASLTLLCNTGYAFKACQPVYTLSYNLNGATPLNLSSTTRPRTMYLEVSPLVPLLRLHASWAIVLASIQHRHTLFITQTLYLHFLEHQVNRTILLPCLCNATA